MTPKPRARERGPGRAPRAAGRTSDRGAAAPGSRGQERAPGPPDRVAAASDRAAAALWVALIVTVVARAALAPVHSMAAWGLNVQRFVPAWAAWPLTLVAALALVPPLARRALPALERAGDLVTRGGSTAVIVAACAAAALVLALPDRAWYLGDFLLRQGAVEEQIGAGKVFPQALPLDRLLHNAAPGWLASHFGLDANASGRMLGAVDAAVLAWAAIAFARALALRGPAACAAAAAVFFGGYLGVFTGYSKAVVELCALTAAAGAAALRVVRTGAGIPGLGIVLALAFALHRSAIGLLPMAVLAWGIALRNPAARPAWRRPAAIAGVALPLAVLAIALPRVLKTFIGIDINVHLAPPEVRGHGGVLAAAFAGLRPLDMANVVLTLTPLALAIPVVLGALGRRPGRGGELAVLAALMLPLVGFMPLLHPAQGMFRDWDNFVAGGAATSLLAAWLVGEALQGANRRSWVATPVVACAALFTLQWLIHHSDVERGMARMRAFLDEPPVRTEAERVTVLDYLGIRSMRLVSYAEAAVELRRAADLVPNPRFLIEWGLAATEAGDYRSALESYRRLIARTPEDPLAWRGYTAMNSRLGDLAEARRGATELLKRVPGDPDAVKLLSELDRIDAAKRDSARAGR